MGGVLFAQEDLSSRRFWFGWPHRPEDAHAIARRVREMSARLAAQEPSWSELWPMLDVGDDRVDAFGLHGERFEGLSKKAALDLYDQLVASGDLPAPPPNFGSVSQLPADRLGNLIDKRTRFDPPPPPAPVSGPGFSFSLADGPPGTKPADDLGCFIWLSVGAYEGMFFNFIKFDLHKDHPMWEDIDRARHVMRAVVEAWDAETAAASGFTQGNDDHERPWMAWRRRPLREFPTPPYARPLPVPFPLDRAGPPDEVRLEFGGELEIWR